MTDLLISILTSIGGTSIVLGGLFGWIGKRHLDKILEKEKSRNTRMLEQLKKDLEKSLFFEKEKFKGEFSIYKELWENIDNLFSETWELHHYYDKPFNDIDIKNINDAFEAYKIAYYFLGKQRPFCNEEIFKSATHLIIACRSEIESFKCCIEKKQNNTKKDDYDFVLAKKESLRIANMIKQDYSSLGVIIQLRINDLSKSNFSAEQN